jgi:hypothetical protein
MAALQLKQLQHSALLPRLVQLVDLVASVVVASALPRVDRVGLVRWLAKDPLAALAAVSQQLEQRLPLAAALLEASTRLLLQQALVHGHPRHLRLQMHSRAEEVRLMSWMTMIVTMVAAGR